MMKSLHPLGKLAVCMIWIVASILIFDMRFQLATILLVVLVLVVAERISPLKVLVLMAPFALFGLGFLTTSVLFRQESDFALRMAGESLLATPQFSAGITLFLRAIACGMISALFALTTDPGALVRALMVQGGLPPRFGYSLFSAMQLVPDLAAEAQQIRLARAMKRGRPPGRFPSPPELASLVVPLLAFAIRRAGRAAIAMEARGLSPSAPRTTINVPRLAPRDLVFVPAALLLLVLFAASIRLAG